MAPGVAGSIPVVQTIWAPHSSSEAREQVTPRGLGPRMARRDTGASDHFKSADQRPVPSPKRETKGQHLPDLPVLDGEKADAPLGQRGKRGQSQVVPLRAGIESRSNQVLPRGVVVDSLGSEPRGGGSIPPGTTR